MFTLFVSGHLVKDPAQRVSAKGTTYATAALIVSTRDGDQVVNLTAFDEALVGLLAGLKKGDTLSAIGQATVGIWDSPDGARASVSVTCSRLMTLADKTASKRKAPARTGAAAAAPTPAAEPFDDDLEGLQW